MKSLKMLIAQFKIKILKIYYIFKINQDNKSINPKISKFKLKYKAKTNYQSNMQIFKIFLKM